MAREVWLEVNGVRTFARVAGAGPLLVLLPGLACSHLYFGPLQEALAGSFEVWAYDPPGHGYSRAVPGEFCKLEELADHLADWLKAAGLEGALLFGHSLGAEILVALAARQPQLTSKLILCSPTGIPEYPNLAWQMLNLARDALRERSALIFRVLRSYFLAGPYRAWCLLKDQLEHHTLPLLPRVKTPVLLITGSRDPVIRPRLVRAFEEHLPKAQMLVIRGGTHAVHDSHTAEVAAAIRQFALAGAEFSPV